MNAIATYSIATALVAALCAHYAALSPGPHRLIGPISLQLSYDYGNVTNHNAPTGLFVALHMVLWISMWLVCARLTNSHPSSMGLGLVAGGALMNTAFTLLNHRVPNYILVGTLLTCNAADLSILLGIAILSLSLTAAGLRAHRRRVLGPGPMPPK
jgi:lipoprotein signal peptidase